jgi:diadenosine tetraphosphate (Ap4A) HIT family hydrolase
MTETRSFRRHGLRRALGLVRCEAAPTAPSSPSDSKSLSPRSSTSRLSSSSLSSLASSTSSFSSSSSSSSSSSHSTKPSVSRKGVTYAHDGAVVCCRFCDILRDHDGEFLFEDERVAVFRPLAPVSDSHVLVVPRCHIRNINALTPCDTELLTHMREVAQLVLEDDSSPVGCKFAFHTPPFNSIDHVHMHAFRTNDRRGTFGAIKYRTDTWWCQSFDVVLSRVVAKSPSPEPFAVCNHQHALVGTSVSTR